jgi:hypothetical protein
MTTKTEQIIADSQHPLKGGTSAALITELRRLDALCAAYWREIEYVRHHFEQPDEDACLVWLNADNDVIEEHCRRVEATDAARREAGEGTTT